MKKYILPLLYSCFNFIFTYAQQIQQASSGGSVTIPVVVHVLYYDSVQNISDAQINSQIAVLNQDYNALNLDLVRVPAPFQSVIGNPHLSFCLAARTPDGNFTTGIERKQTSDSSFEFGYNGMKFDSLGGLNAWDASKYLNIWVCNLEGGLLGYTQLPPGPATTDGCVILYSAFGNTGNLLHQYNKGRTATREIGHWLGLFNIPGDNGCSNGNIADIPLQSNVAYGCPVFPVTDVCSPNYPGIMFMNFMEYTDDSCMYMFTADQATEMNTVIDSIRTSILTSNACTPPTGLNEINASTFVNLYPNPADDVIYVDVRLTLTKIANVTVFDMTGKKISALEVNRMGQQIINLDVSTLSAGIYTVILNTDEGSIAKQFVKTH